MKIPKIHNNDVGIAMHIPYLPQPISQSRDEAISFLKAQNPNNDRHLVCIDGTNFSDSVMHLDDATLKIEPKTLLLPAGIDGIVTTTKNIVELALPVGDCGALVAYHKYEKNHKIIGSAHLGYKGVISDGDLEKNGMIENFVKSLMDAANTKNLNDFEMLLSPMAGKNFELEKSFFDAKILPFIRKQIKKTPKQRRYNFRPEMFYSVQKKSVDGVERVYFDLKKLITATLSYVHGMDTSKIYQKFQSTTSPYNRFPSFRSHSLAKNVLQKVDDIEAIRASKGDNNIENIQNVMKKFWVNQQQAILILAWNVEFYADHNERLSLNIYTKKSS